MKKRLNQPWSVQIELTEGCSRQCEFCGINAIREKPGKYKFMTQETLENTLKGCQFLCPEARYEFAMHGEPTMHPEFQDMIYTTRKMLPKAQIQVTTNGVRFIKGDMQKLLDVYFAIGVDFILLDTYYPERDVLREKAFRLKGMRVLDFYKSEFKPYANYRRAIRRWVVLMDDIGERDGEDKTRVVLNHAGGSKTKPVPKESLKKTCTNPFREVSVCWNGNVNVCCMDWRHEYICGNVNTSSLKRIWYGERFELARKFLQNKERIFAPCKHCDKNAGPRVGLLPKYGKLSKSDHVLLGVE